MIKFTTRRLLFLIPVLFGILAVVFIIVRAIPGDPCTALMGEKVTAAECAAFMVRYGLSDNIIIQFVRYLGQVIVGNLGISIQYNRPVLDYVAQRLPMTFELAIGAVIFASVFGIFLGTISALRRNSIIDTLTMIGANIGISMPIFWLGLLLAYFFALTLKGTPFVLPPAGRLNPGTSVASLADVWHLTNLPVIPALILEFFSNSVIFNSIVTGNFSLLWNAIQHLILPWVAVGAVRLGFIARMTRSSLLEVLGQDYIRTAKAKGLRQTAVIVKHALRNALIPIVTLIGLSIGGLLSGAVLAETVFGLPGMGSAMVLAIEQRDYPVVQGFVIINAFIFVLVNLIIDVSYAYLDPRIRLN